MQHCDTLIRAGWTVTADPSFTVLRDAAVAIRDGRIIAILDRDAADAEFQASATIDRPHHALIPGLVNAHCHAAMTLLRGFADDQPLDIWLQQHIWPVERRHVSAEMVRDGTELAIAEMLRAGVTAFSDQYFYPEIVAETAARRHVRAVIATPIIDGNSGWAANASEHMTKAADLVHDPYADHPLIRTAYAPHSPYTMSDASLAELRVMADQLDLPVQMHLHETVKEITDSEREHRARPIERVGRLGLLKSTFLAVHAVHLNDADIDELSIAGASVAHCPASNLKLGSGMANVARLQQAGIAVGVGTDGAASNNRLDVLGETRLASLLAKGIDHDATALSAETALRMATIDGAKAIGIDDVAGSIEVGKYADLSCIDLKVAATQPIYDVTSQVVYAASCDQVSDVWVAGRPRVEDGRVTGIDLESLFARADEWQRRIAQG